MMKSITNCRNILIMACFLFLFLIVFGSFSHAATISGTVYESTGTTPITDATIRIKVISSSYDPCPWGWWPEEVCHVDTSSGSYTTPDLNPGTYYLMTDNLNASSYVNEFWADPASIPYPDCTAQTITVGGSNITGKDFQLDTGHNVSGTVFKSDGSTPIPGHDVNLIFGDCCGRWTCFSTAYTAGNGTYTIKGVPDGNFYLNAGNQENSNFVKEWWTGDTDPSSYYCNDAVEIVVTGGDVTGKNFHLADGGTVEGTLFENDGYTPVTGEGNSVLACMVESCSNGGCQWNYYANSNSGDGTYSMKGLPPEDIYLKTQASNHANEWWKSPESTYQYVDADKITITSGVTLTGRNFQLDTGGSLAGVVVDKNNSPQQDIEVECWNNAVRDWKSTLTAANGSFTLSNLPPGPAELEVCPDVSTGLVVHIRNHWFDQNENRHLGTIRLQQGAKITGVIKLGTVPLADVEYSYGRKFEIGWGETEEDGSFEFRLPLGTYTLTLDSDDGYSMVPVEIEVTDVNATYNQGDLAAYNHTNGRSISGTVTDSAVHHGKFAVLAFLNDQEFTPNIFGGICELAVAEPEFSSPGDYQLYVPASLNKVKLLFVLWSEDENELGTMTVLDISDDVTAPSSVNDYAYNSAGHTVDGYVKDRKTGEGIYFTEVMLYKQVGGKDEFAGFAETDNTGKYTFYNVRPGTYRIAVNAIDYNPDTKWSSNFDVNANVTVPDIKMRKTMAMPWVYLLLLFD
jgi:hypothetical protein